MDFGTLTVDGEEKTLSNSSFGVFMLHPDREIRKEAYRRFYSVFDGHKNTLSELYGGSILRDIYVARSPRGSKAPGRRPLFPDNVPGEVYDNLVASVSDNLEPLHRYYALRKKVLGLEELRLYDTKVSLIPDVKVRTSYADAVDTVLGRS